MKAKNRLTSIVAAFVFLGFFSSCTVYREYTIDVFQPGEVAIPPNVRTVAIAYRNFKYTGDTLIHYYKSDYQLRKVKNDPNDLDSILVGYCLQELSAQLKSGNTVQEVKILPLSVFKKHSGNKLPTLSNSLLNQLTESAKADLLIILDTYSCFFSEFPSNNGNPKSNEVISVAVWSVYNPESQRLIDIKSMIDTVFWNGYDEHGNFERKTKLPDRRNALQIASKLAGVNYAKRFKAQWKTVSRMYSIPPLPDFTLAAEYLEKGEQDKAIALWEKYTPSKNGKLAIIACYNLALGYEMKDDLETASNWLDTAYKLALRYGNSDDKVSILAYSKIINKRKVEIKRLNAN